jgi:hypothetical protein
VTGMADHFLIHGKTSHAISPSETQSHKLDFNGFSLFRKNLWSLVRFVSY